MKIVISIYIVGVIIALLVIIISFKNAKEELKGRHCAVGLLSWFLIILLSLVSFLDMVIYDFGKPTKGKIYRKK